MENKIEIRLATSTDATEVVRLIKILALDDGETSDVDTRFVKEYLAFPGCGIFLACEAEKILGLLSFSMRPNLYHTGTSCLIEELVVDETARNRGIGGMLIDAISEKAETEGCEEISVSTMPDNSGAIRFYKSHGFEDEAVYLERHIHEE